MSHDPGSDTPDKIPHAARVLQGHSLVILAGIALALLLGAVAASSASRAALAAAMLVVLIAFTSRQPARTAGSALPKAHDVDGGARTDGDSGTTVLYSLPLLLAITATDFSGYLRSTAQPRFVIVLVPLILYVVHLIRRVGTQSLVPSLSWTPWMVLTIYTLAGSLVGRYLLGNQNTALSIALASLIGLVVVRPKLSERDARRLIWWLGTIALLYIILNAAALTGYADFLSSDPPGNYRHEKAWFIAVGFTALIISRRRVGTVVAGFCTVYIYSQYSAATYILALVVAVMTSVANSRDPHQHAQSPFSVARRVFVAVTTSALVVFVAVNRYNLLNFANEYFNSVGKQDNSETRLLALQLAWDRVQNAPVWGSLYTGETSLQVPSFELGRKLLSIESHNDFLATWMLGGAVALFLLLWWIIRVNVEAAQTLALLSSPELGQHRGLALSCLVMFNCFWAAALFNPLLTQFSAACCVASTYLVLHALNLFAKSQDTTSAETARTSA